MACAFVYCCQDNTSLNEIHELSRPISSSKLKSLCQQFSPNLAVSEIGELLDLINKDSLFYKATSEGGPLSTAHKRLTFFKDNVPYVEPSYYRLGEINGTKRTFAYVPIIPMLRCLLNKPDIKRLVNSFKWLSWS